MLSLFLNTLKSTYSRMDKSYLIKNGSWLMFGQLFFMLASLGLAYVFANYVDKADYGIYKYILSLGIIFSAFSLNGMAQSVIQATARGNISFIKTGFKKSLKYGLIVTLIGISAAIYYYVNDNIPIAIGCLVIALFQPLINAGQLIYFYLQGLKKFNYSTSLQIIKTIIVSSITILAIFLTENILYVVATYFVANASIVMIQYYAVRAYSHYQSSKEEETDKYVSYAKHSSVRDFILGVVYELDKLLIFQRLGATELAIYTFAIAIPEHIKGACKSLALLIVVKFTGYGLEDIRKHFLKKVLIFGIALTFITAAYILAAPYLFLLLFPAYTEAVILTQIFSLSLLSMISIFPMSVLQSQMMEKQLYIINSLNAILQIILLVIFLELYGLIGVILARILTRYLSTITLFILLKYSK